MPETKSNGLTHPVEPQVPAQPPPDQTQLYSAPEATKTPIAAPAKDGEAASRTPATPEAKLLEIHSQQALRPPQRRNYAWIALPIVLLLIALAFYSMRPKPQARGTAQASRSQADEAKPDLSNYSAFLAKNKALIEKYSEQALTDEPFAGRAPLVFAPGGPLVSAEIDPELAALADAFKVRVQVMQGSQAQTRDNVVTQVTKGDFRGFKVQAFEKLEKGKVVYEEATLTTPKNGVIKTVNRILSILQRTDADGLSSEVRAAGMEYLPLPGAKEFRLQLRVMREWGKPVAADRLIAGENVGRVALGMPLDLLQSRIAVGDSILKRKVLINEVYHDVYKVMDQGGDPLFFVYEKEGRVLGIWVISAVFKSGRGVGINSSLDQLRIHYPVVSLLRSAKKTPYVKVEGVSGKLIIQGERDKKVVAILIGDSPEFT